MTSFPTPYTIVQRTPTTTDDYDAYGNPIPGWETIQRPVYGWWVPGPGDEPEGVVDARVIADVAVVCPTFPATPQDEFEIPGFAKLRMEGIPQSYASPFGFQPGMRLNLKFVDQ